MSLHDSSSLSTIWPLVLTHISILTLVILFLPASGLNFKILHFHSLAFISSSSQSWDFNNYYYIWWFIKLIKSSLYLIRILHIHFSCTGPKIFLNIVISKTIKYGTPYKVYFVSAYQEKKNKTTCIYHFYWLYKVHCQNEKLFLCMQYGKLSNVKKFQTKKTIIILIIWR